MNNYRIIKSIGNGTYAEVKLVENKFNKKNML